MDKKLEEIIIEVKKGSNRAFCDLINYCIENEKYEMILEYMDNFINTGNKLYKNDYNLYLLLLNTLIQLPDKYIEYVRKLPLEDILIPLTKTKDESIILENEVRTLIKRQKFIPAYNKLFKIKTFYNERTNIINYLLRGVIKAQKQDKHKVIALVNDKKYENIISYLESKKNRTGLSQSDEYILTLSRDIVNIIKTNNIPSKGSRNDSRLFSCIDDKRYVEALEASIKYSRDKNVPLAENTLYLLLKDICKLIEEIECGLNNKVDLDTILLCLKNKKYTKGFDILNKYLINNNKQEYEFVVLNLIKISILKGDTSFEEPLNVLKDIINNNYEFDINEYIYEYQQAILNNNNELAVLYLNIIDNSYKLVKDNGKLAFDRDASSANIREFNKLVDYVYSIVNRLEQEGNLIILENLDEEEIRNIYEIIREIPNAVSFSIYDKESLKVVIRTKYDKKLVNKENIAYKGKVFYQNKDYDNAIKTFLEFFALEDVITYIYERIGYAYIGKMDKENALKYLTVASCLNKMNNCRDYDYKIILNLNKNKFYVPDINDKIIDIDETYGINNIEEVAYLVFQKGMDIESACDYLGFNEYEKHMSILIIARECYYQGMDIQGDKFMKIISKAEKKHKKVINLYKDILLNKKYYRYREDTNHKKLVLNKKENV